MADAAQQRRLSGLRRAIRIAARASKALLLLLAVYVGLVQLDVVPSPFDPRVRGDLELARSGPGGLRVLFVGNSFTYYNEMPALVHELAASAEGSEPIFAAAYAAPAWSLEAASKDDGLARLLRDVEWDVVVLQEQSRLPSFDREVRAEEFDPFAFELDAEIGSSGAETVLFMTWAYKGGDDENSRDDTFSAMQARLARGYSELGQDLRADVAPVGLAWAEALSRAPDSRLWADDGRHPSQRGSYLAACVFYALLSERSPEGIRFTDGLPASEALFLQRVAADVVADAEMFGDR